MSKLGCVKGDNKGDEFVLAEGTNVIGRAATCGVVLFDKKCSREHCHVHKKGRYYSVEDLESRNGTYLNGRKLPPGKNVSIKMGDQIRIGRTILQLSNKPIGNLLAQTAVDVAVDMQNHKYNKLLSSAARDASAASKNHTKDRNSVGGFLRKLFGRK